MRKFKLIKEYPGSPKLGTLVEYESLRDRFIYSKSKEYFESIFVTYLSDNSLKWSVSLFETYKEFWQEIIEKDYEILSFERNDVSGIIFNLKNNGLYTTVSGNCEGTLDISYLLKPNFNIYQVKRLSDRE